MVAMATAMVVAMAATGTRVRATAAVGARAVLRWAPAPATWARSGAAWPSAARAQAFHASARSLTTESVVERCRQKIHASLNAAKVEVKGSNDDPNGSHVSIVCISEEFAGKSPVQRQRMVMKAIWEELSGPVHAVDSIVAKTPKEAGSM